jgi:hypothetical protein
MGNTVRHGDDRSPLKTALLGALGTLLALAVIASIQAFYYWSDKAERARATAHALDELVRLRTEQREALASYRWLDQPKGVAAIPIDRAMQLVVHEQRPSRP